MLQLLLNLPLSSHLPSHFSVSVSSVITWLSVSVSPTHPFTLTITSLALDLDSLRLSAVSHTHFSDVEIHSLIVPKLEIGIYINTLAENTVQVTIQSVQ